MPLIDLPIDQLRAYRPASPAPDDFSEFWLRTLTEAGQAPLNVAIEVIEYPNAPGRPRPDDASVVDFGFTHVALVQVGADTQERFISWAATELLPALRAS